jgi:hypothetical protein
MALSGSERYLGGHKVADADGRQVVVLAASGGGATEVEVKNDSGSAIPTTETRPATATLSNVSGSASSVTLLASNANARLRTVFNDSTANLFLKFGATASTSSFTVKIAAGGYYEFPQPLYTGLVDGIWDAANGAARLTEVA